jgi:hypothetical protein
VNPDIDADGVIRWRDWADADHEWGSLAELAADWWRYQRLTGRAKEADPMIAWECVREFGDLDDAPHPRVMDVIQALVDAAQSDDELSLVGAGPLEDLLSHSGHGALVVDEVERRARQQSRFRAALASVWLGGDVPRDVRKRLSRVGAADLSEGPGQQS